MSNTVTNYFDRIGNKELLTRKQERELAQKIEQGNKKAKEELIISNLRLVINIAKKYKNLGVDFEDLIQAGNVGLIKAVEKFDWRKGYKFSTYATWWIKQKVLRELENHGRTIRVPARQNEKLRKIRKAEKKLKDRKIEATPQNIAEEMDPFYGQEISADKILEIRLKTQITKSLDQKLKEEKGSATRLKFVQDDGKNLSVKEINEERDKEKLHEAMNLILSDREKQILNLRYGLKDEHERTLEKTGKVFDVSRERVRQIQERAIDKLKKYFLDHPEKKPKSVGIS